MPTNKIIRTDSSLGYGPNWSGIRIDISDSTLVFNPAGTELVAVTTAATQTLTNKTLTAPTLTAVAITGTSTIGNGMTITTPVINGAVTGSFTLTAVTPGALNFASLVPSTETSGSVMTTGSTWIDHSAVGGCGIKLLLSNTAATGDFATMRLRARSNAAGATVCGNFSASAGQNDHGDLYAVQGYAQPNAYTNAAAKYVVGLYSCIDRTTGGTSIGYDWSTWIDTHMQVKASGSSYLCRLSHNGTIANDGCFTIYNGGRMPVLFNFEDAAGFLTDAGSPGTTAAGYIAVKTPAGTKYISLFTA